VRRGIVWLERVRPSIVGCHVAIEAPRRRHRQGGLFRVRVEVGVPGGEVVVSRSPPKHHGHPEVYVAIRDAFRAARRESMDRARLMRRDVKDHVAPLTGHVARLLDEPRGPCGFFVTGDSREAYCHEHALVDGCDDRRAGDRVRFVEEAGDRGPQASAVKRIGRATAGGRDEGAAVTRRAAPPAPGPTAARRCAPDRQQRRGATRSRFAPRAPRRASAPLPSRPARDLSGAARAAAPDGLRRCGRGSAVDNDSRGAHICHNKRPSLFRMPLHTGAKRPRASRRRRSRARPIPGRGDER